MLIDIKSKIKMNIIEYFPMNVKMGISKYSIKFQKLFKFSILDYFLPLYISNNNYSHLINYLENRIINNINGKNDLTNIFINYVKELNIKEDNFIPIKCDKFENGELINILEKISKKINLEINLLKLRIYYFFNTIEIPNLTLTLKKWIKITPNLFKYIIWEKIINLTLNISITNRKDKTNENEIFRLMMNSLYTLKKLKINYFLEKESFSETFLTEIDNDEKYNIFSIEINMTLFNSIEEKGRCVDYLREIYIKRICSINDLFSLISKFAGQIIELNIFNIEYNDYKIIVPIGLTNLKKFSFFHINDKISLPVIKTIINQNNNLESLNFDIDIFPQKDERSKLNLIEKINNIKNLKELNLGKIDFRFSYLISQNLKVNNLKKISLTHSAMFDMNKLFENNKNLIDINFELINFQGSNNFFYNLPNRKYESIVLLNYTLYKSNLQSILDNKENLIYLELIVYNREKSELDLFIKVANFPRKYFPFIQEYKFAITEIENQKSLNYMNNLTYIKKRVLN